MSKSITLLLVLVFLATSCVIAAKPVSAATADSWVSKAPMHQARSGLGVAAVNGKIYAIGGTTASGFMPNIGGSVVLGFRDLDGFVGTNEEYDPATNVWTTKASMPTPRIVFATAVYQNKIYCIGGRNIVGSDSGYYTGANEVYDPATNTWETRAPMPTARGWLTAGVVNGKIYLMGGEPNGTLIEVYDPKTDSWSTQASMPIAARLSAVVDNKIYVIGSTLQIFDLGTDEWSQGAPLPSMSGVFAAGATTGVLAPKRIYVMGPQSNYEPNNGVYDSESDTWSFGVDLPTRRYNSGVAVLNDKLYVIGGHTYDVGRNGYVEPVAVNEQYSPIGYGTSDPSTSPTPSPSSTPSQEPTSTPETKQPISIPPIWIVAIAALVAVVIVELIIIYFLKVKRTKS